MTDWDGGMLYSWLLLAAVIWITALALDSIRIEEKLDECERTCDTQEEGNE